MKKYITPILIGIISLVLDLVTKFIFKGKNIDLIPNIFTITYAENPGLVFGIFEGNLIFTILVPVLVILLIGYYCYKKELNLIGGALIISGLLGNLIDRIVNGYVVDWIFVRIYPKYSISLFNIADASLVIGIIICVYYLMKKK